MNTFNEYYRDNVVPSLMDQFKYKSPMEVPRLKKITLNMGLGTAVNDKKILDHGMVVGKELAYVLSGGNTNFNNELAFVSQTNKPRWFSVERYMLKIISKTSHRRDNAKKHMDKICKQLNCSYLLNSYYQHMILIQG